MRNYLFPNLAVSSVLDLTVDQLRNLHVEALILDVDCTLKEYEKQEPDSEIIEWLNILKEEKFSLCLLSNGIEKRIKPVADSLQLPYIAKACKPSPKGVRRALDLLAVPAGKAVVVGDQIFADILAGNLAGVFTILVTPIKPEQEHWFTRIKRPWEKIVLRSFWKKFPDGVWNAESK